MRSAPHRSAAADAQSAEIQPAFQASPGLDVYCEAERVLHTKASLVQMYETH